MDRDKGCCSYVNPRTGRKRGSRRFLHIDHILSFALGGGAETDNLRLLCAGHNQIRALQTFKLILSFLDPIDSFEELFLIEWTRNGSSLKNAVNGGVTSK